MAKSHKRQHWVPRSYLAAWADPDVPDGYEPYLNVISRDGDVLRRRAATKLFTETDLYTIKLPDGRRDLRLEHGLSQLEDSFAEIRRDFLEHRRLLPLRRFAKLMAFVAAMQVRTPAMRNHHQAFWREVVEKADRMERQMRAMTPEQRRRAAGMSVSSRGRSLSIAQARYIAENTMTAMLEPMLTAQVPVLVRMRCIVLCTNAEPGFITSDEPVVWRDPEWHKTAPAYRALGLANRRIEITMPASPRQALLIVHGPAGLEYRDVDEPAVTAVNRSTRFSCDRQFVVRRPYLEPIWFDPGEEPEDSWEKIHGRNMPEGEAVEPS